MYLNDQIIVYMNTIDRNNYTIVSPRNFDCHKPYNSTVKLQYENGIFYRVGTFRDKNASMMLNASTYTTWRCHVVVFSGLGIVHVYFDLSCRGLIYKKLHFQYLGDQSFLEFKTIYTL